MRKESNSSSKLFLTELMIAIFFFAVIASVCIQAFSEAHAMSMDSEQLVQGINAASNAAEYFIIWDGEKESWQKVFPEGGWEDAESFQMEFDEDWKPVQVAGFYVLNMEVTGEQGLQTADITVEEKDSGKVIYQLEVERGK